MTSAAVIGAGILALTQAAISRGDGDYRREAAAHDPPAAHEVMAPAPSVPGESLYQLAVELTLQDGRRLPLDALHGHPMLVTMFYTSCEGVCPLLAFALRRMVAALPEAERARLRVLMVSFDPVCDSPQALREFAELHQIDRPAWLLARADAGAIRELAAVLGIRYRELPGGLFSHSGAVTLLDADGISRARTTTLQQLDPGFLKAIEAALR